MPESADPSIRRLEQAVSDLVAATIHPHRVPFEVTAHALRGEPVSFRDASSRPFEPVQVGDRWGGAWDTVWFRMQGSVPSAWQNPVALIHLGGAEDVGFSAEGLVWDPSGTPLQGLHHRHREVPLAPGGDGRVELFVEAAANPRPPWGSDDWPPLRPDYDGDPLYVLEQAEMADTDLEMQQLHVDLTVLLQLAAAVDDRRDEILRAVAAACDRLDPRQPSRSAPAARHALRPLLQRATSCPHRVTAVGHAHIDSAWLWPVRETVRKCARTFANQLRLMERFPEHRFSCSQAAQYEWIRCCYPVLFEQIKARVAERRWEPVGGMWVEADSNLPSGESLVRQILQGKRFFAEHFGVETHEMWIPDVFGYSAALPQIARQAGITALVTQKMSWNDTNSFPHSTFWWEGHDGSVVLAHFPPAHTYNGRFSADELAACRDNHKGRASGDESLYPFGHGDGGGGPTATMLERARRFGGLEGLPSVAIGTVAEFLDGLAAAHGCGHGAAPTRSSIGTGDDRRAVTDLPVWVGELYLEAHRGTYTTHADVKKANRRGEEALRAAEMWSVAAGLDRSEDLDRIWKLLLFNQFHDIIPGTSIGWVYDQAAREHAEVLAVAAEVAREAQGQIAGEGDAAVVFNPSSYPRAELVEVAGEWRMVVVPGCGWTTVEPSSKRATVGERSAVGMARAGEGWIDNDHLRVSWDRDGNLSSVWDKDASREVLAPGARGNVFQLHEDRPRSFDAWEVDQSYLDDVTDLTDAVSVEVLDHGPLRAAVRIVRRFGGSEIDQVVSLSAASRQVEFHTQVEWHESHKFLKVAFPVDVRSTRATYEIQHGHVERPTVANTSWDRARFEVCAHRWADLSEPGYGVALLNDCKYGYDVRGNVMRLSLLRAPGYPDPVADRGRHRFAYALLPHQGDLRSAGVVERAEAFNLPLVVRPGAASTGTGRLVEVDRRGVSVEAVKWAEDKDGVVLRVCEVFGSRGPARVKLNVPHGLVVRADLLERGSQGIDTTPDGAVQLDLRPFELVTVRFRAP